ncbi:MAG TPA: hypothetical protein PKD78_12350, partial [Saprospiraceae bacterium]|nr:hypothetical protein [Saprospiraceae bacterium]
PPVKPAPPTAVAEPEHSGEKAAPPLSAKPAITKPGPSTPVLVKKTEPIPSGYRIHLASWKTRIDRNVGQMGLISGVKEEQADGQYHYYTATFATRKEAEELLPDIKNLGFRTAKIVEAGHH